MPCCRGDELCEPTSRRRLSTFEAVQSYRVTIGRTDMRRRWMRKRSAKPSVRFRAALSNSGPKAVQQRPTASLLEVVTAQIKARWIAGSNSTWQEKFAAAQELLERVDSGDLHGSPRRQDQRRGCRASKIAVVRNTDPVRERAALEERLKVEGLKACLERVNELIGELRAAIAAIDLERAAMMPEVRVAIERATSVDGLPLGEVTPELLAALQSAGVLDDLVVRRL